MDHTMPEDWFRLLASWTEELMSTVDRVDNLIGERHQPTKGSYRESLLRRLLRRILPARYRVSTGFIYRGSGEPSKQVDVLIWDAQRHSAILEEGELVILPIQAVAAMIEVKSTLSPGELRSALDLLCPSWLVNWRHTSESSETGLQQNLPDTPIRAVFAFSSNQASADRTTESLFGVTQEYYRSRFRGDTDAVLAHSSNLNWSNVIDAICIADHVEVEQTRLTIDCGLGSADAFPGLVAFRGQVGVGNIAVGRFCMYLLSRLCEWNENPYARRTVFALSELTSPGLCSLVPMATAHGKVKICGGEFDLDSLYIPNS